MWHRFCRFYFLDLQKSLQMVTTAMKLKDACSLKKSYDQPRQHIKKQRHNLANKSLSNQSYGFSSSHIWLWKLDHKEDWAPKNWCFWTMVLEKTLESPLDCKQIQPVNPIRNQSWIFIGRTDAEAETLILWSPDVKNWLIWKDLDAGKDWRWEEKGMTEDEMVGWHHWLDEHEFEQISGIRIDREAWRAWSIGSQRVRHDWVTELNRTERKMEWKLFSSSKQEEAKENREERKAKIICILYCEKLRTTKVYYFFDSNMGKQKC